MKKFFKYVGISFLVLVTAILVWAYLSFTGFTGCGDCLTEQDYAFMEKIKANLHEVGDTVMVADIHPGDWEDVCVERGGFDSGLWGFAEDRENVVIINDAYPRVTDRYSDSAVVFRHSDTELEIYRMIPKYMSYSRNHRDIPKDAKTTCIKREDAYFELLWNEDLREKPLNIQINRSPDYMLVILKSIKENK